MDYEVFKRDLESYKGLTRELNRLEEIRATYFYELEGVKGVSFDKVTGTYNEAEVEARKLELIELINAKEASIEYIQRRIVRIDRNISRLPAECQEICELNKKGWSFERIGRKIGYVKSGVQKLLKREVEKL